jgi:ornithine carbamoyltransferase
VSAAASGIEGSRQSANLTSLLTWTRDDLDTVLDRAKEILSSADRVSPLSGRRAILLWETPVQRCREDFRGALIQAEAEIAEQDGLELLQETPEKLATRLQGFDVAVYRTPAHPRLQNLVRLSSVPLVSAGTSYSTPFRVLTEVFGLGSSGIDVDDAEIVWAGKASPRLNSWLEAAVRFRFALDVLLPPEEVTDPALTAYAVSRAKGAVRFQPTAGPSAGARVVLLGEGGRSLLGPGTLGGDPVYVEEDQRGPWGAEVDHAVALGVLEEVWTRTRRARRSQP